jgi:hypothetical protein
MVVSAEPRLLQRRDYENRVLPTNLSKAGRSPTTARNRCFRAVSTLGKVSAPNTGHLVIGAKLNISFKITESPGECGMLQDLVNDSGLVKTP